MVRRVERFADGGNRFNALVAHESLELLPDHLDALFDRFGVLLGVLKRQAHVAENG